MGFPGPMNRISVPTPLFGTYKMPNKAKCRFNYTEWLQYQCEGKSLSKVASIAQELERQAIERKNQSSGGDGLSIAACQNPPRRFQVEGGFLRMDAALVPSLHCVFDGHRLFAQPTHIRSIAGTRHYESQRQTCLVMSLRLQSNGYKSKR